MIDLAMQRTFEATRRRMREAYPKNASGEHFCPKHSKSIGLADYGCEPCAAETRAAVEREERLTRTQAWWASSESLHFGGEIGRLPDFAYARVDNADWRRRTDRRVVDRILHHDLRRSLTIFGTTGCGKTSAVVAHMHDLRRRVFAAIEKAEVPLPPAFLYVAGYELGDAQRQRRFGEEHDLIQAALTRQVLVLDELHPNHTPANLVFAILDARLTHGLPSIVLCGMQPAQFGEAFGGHLLRRLLDAEHLDAFAKGTK